VVEHVQSLSRQLFIAHAAHEGEVVKPLSIHVFDGEESHSLFPFGSAHHRKFQGVGHHAVIDQIFRSTSKEEAEAEVVIIVDTATPTLNGFHDFRRHNMQIDDAGEVHRFVDIGPVRTEVLSKNEVEEMLSRGSMEDMVLDIALSQLFWDEKGVKASSVCRKSETVENFQLPKPGEVSEALTQTHRGGFTTRFSMHRADAAQSVSLSHQAV
jgi:hypothetical protein